MLPWKVERCSGVTKDKEKRRGKVGLSDRKSILSSYVGAVMMKKKNWKKGQEKLK